MPKIKKVIPGLGAVLSLLATSLLAQPSAAAEEKKDRRAFYLTRSLHAGDATLTACATGFHLASLWEIFDPSNLRYDTSLGFTLADSGSGPPTIPGWIRTGGAADPGYRAGGSNCNAWTSHASDEFGTVAGLNSFWVFIDQSSAASPWFGFPENCGTRVPVWCVEDD